MTSFLKSPSEVSPVVWLFLISVIAYWQLSLMQYGFVYDNCDAILPWRFFVGTSLQHGVFPFWNPYQHNGYPIFGDMRSVFNPEMWLVGSTIGYSVYTLHILITAYIFLAGVGAYKLSLHFSQDKKVALLCGIVYLLSGFIVNQSQDISRTLAATWLPYAFLFFYRLQQAPSLKNALLASLFFYLLITGGYLPVSFMLFYIVAFVFIFRAGKILITKNYKDLKPLLLYHGLSALIIILLLAPNIITYFYIADSVTRYGGLTYEFASFGNMPVKGMVSTIIPYAIPKLKFSASDVSLSSIYFGLIPLMLIIISFFYKRDKKAWIFLGIAVFFLFSSFGKESFLHPFLFRYIPLMDLFRHPSFFSLITLLFVILILSVQFDFQYLGSKQFRKRLILLSAGVVLILLITAIAAFFTKTDNTFHLFHFNKPWHIRIEEASLHENIIVHALIQIMLLLLLILSLTKIKATKILIRVVILLVAIEMAISVQLMIHHTGVSQFSPRAMHEEINSQPKTFILPDLSVSTKTIDDNSNLKQPFWRNTSIFTKAVSSKSFNSFTLAINDTLTLRYPELLNATFENPVAYLSTNVLPAHKLESFDPDSITPCLTFAESFELQDNILNSDNQSSIEPLKFYPNNFIFEVKNETPAVFVLQQTYFDRWEVFVNDRKAELFKVNKKFTGVFIDSGHNQIEFLYTNNPVKFATYFSLLLFILIVFVVIMMISDKRARLIAAVIFLISLSGSAIWAQINITANKKTADIPLKTRAKIHNQEDRQLIILNTDLKTGFDQSKNFLKTRVDRYNRQPGLPAGLKSEFDTIALYNYRLSKPIEMIGILKRYYNSFHTKSAHLTDHLHFVRKEDHETPKLYRYFDDMMLTKPAGDNQEFFTKIESTDEFSFVERFKGEQLKEASANYCFISAEIKMINSGDAYLTFHHTRDGINMYWEGRSIENYLIDTQAWQYVCLGVVINFPYRNNDDFTISLWNPGKAKFLVRNMKLEFYEKL
ncbi:MAG: hypothetical protein EA393_12700 [Bacteroidetes bacterium]|nr:MAG: hypothetical protein EA393_12700 [Bacteroidota bacterium]